MSNTLPHPITPIKPSPSMGGTARAGRIVLHSKTLMIAGTMLVLTLLAPLFDVGGSALGTYYLVALGALCSSMLLVRALYVRAERFLFSPSFWLMVTFLFYFVLKSLDLWSKDLLTPTYVEALWLGTLFLVTYAAVYAWVDSRVRRRRAAIVRSSKDMVITPKASWGLLAVYTGFKLLGVALVATVGGDGLEVSAATQNAGAAYLYRIPAVGNIIFLALLFDAFKYRRGWTVVMLALALYLTDAVLSTSRLSLVLVVMWSAFLYHRYRHPISLWRVALIGSPLVLVVVLFGYARNLEVGSAAAYAEAASVLLEQPSLISDLFLQRMDMLPELVAGLDLQRAGVLPDLNGASYIYAFLHSVPRSLWENKPLLTAALVTSENHPLAFADGVNMFPSIILEGILNFGYMGIIFSGALIALLNRLLERAVDSNNFILNVWALSVLTFPMGLFNEGVHSNFTGNIIYMTAITAFLYFILKYLGLVPVRSK